MKKKMLSCVVSAAVLASSALSTNICEVFAEQTGAETVNTDGGAVNSTEGYFGIASAVKSANAARAELLRFEENIEETAATKTGDLDELDDEYVNIAAAVKSLNAARNASSNKKASSAKTYLEKDETSETIELGADIRAYINGDEIHIYGSGRMDNFFESPFRYDTDVKTVRFCDSAEAPITSIGSDVFSKMSELETVYLSDNIEVIGSHAFYLCESLKYFRYGADDANDKMVLPAKLTDIGEQAFNGCKNAEFGGLTFPNSVESIGIGAFNKCEGITGLTVPESVQSIGNFAFSSCTLLHNARIRTTTTDLGFGIFWGCSWLRTITVACLGDGESIAKQGEFSNIYFYDDVPERFETVRVLGGSTVPSFMFYGMESLKNVTLPDTVKVIGECAFSDCTSLESLPIPSGTVAIGTGAFLRCNLVSAEELVLPSTIETIGDFAFGGCTGISKVTVDAPDCIIGDKAFSGCRDLKEAVIGSGVKEIGNYVFESCPSLEKLTLPYAAHTSDLDSNSMYNVRTMFSERCYDEETEYCPRIAGGGVPKALTEITITGGNRIPLAAFEGMSGVKKITIPDSVVMVDDFAFNDCSSLEAMPITNNIEHIGYAAYANCSSVCGELVIPETVSAIGKYAFCYCSGISKLTVKGSDCEMEDSVFSGCSGLKEAVITDGVKSIGQYIFDKCDSLEKLTLPYAAHNSDLDSHSKYNVSTMFSESCDDEREYKLRISGGGAPKSLTEIIITGGRIIPNCAFEGLSGVKKITIPDSVVMIGDFAFTECSSLEVLPITNNTTTIGRSAFGGCSSAVYDKLIFPASLEGISEYAFHECFGISSIVVNGSGCEIEPFAFSGCSGLKEAVITDGVKSVGQHAFNKCDSLAKLTLPYAGCTVDPPMAAENNVGLLFSDSCNDEREYKLVYTSGGVPKVLTEITITGGRVVPDYAFEGLSGVKKITIPDSIDYIGTAAFLNCSGLDTLAITGEAAVEGVFRLPSSLTGIGDSAFSNCVGLTEIVVPDTVTAIGEYAFIGCENLTNAVIGSGVEQMGREIFCGCSSLRELVVPFAGSDPYLRADSPSLANFFFGEHGDSKKFYAAGNGTAMVPMSLRSITVTGGCALPAFSFAGMDRLERVMLGESIVGIDSGAFDGCTGLESIDIMGSSLNDVTVGEINDAFIETSKSFNAIAVTADPDDITAVSGERVSFTSKAVGSGIRYQWQYSADGGKTWSDMANCTDSVCSFTATEKQNGYLYRCTAVNSAGIKVESAGAKLTVVKAEEPFVKGDVNGDGKFDENDFTALRNWILGASDELVNWEAADLCADRSIDIFDLCIMRSMLNK